MAAAVTSGNRKTGHNVIYQMVFNADKDSELEVNKTGLDVVHFFMLALLRVGLLDF